MLCFEVRCGQYYEILVEAFLATRVTHILASNGPINTYQLSLQNAYPRSVIHVEGILPDQLLSLMMSNEKNILLTPVDEKSDTFKFLEFGD